MDDVILIDTDSFIRLVHSDIGQSYIQSANRLRVTKGVKEEVEGLAKNSETKQAVINARKCL